MKTTMILVALLVVLHAACVPAAGAEDDQGQLRGSYGYGRGNGRGHPAGPWRDEDEDDEERDEGYEDGHFRGYGWGGRGNGRGPQQGGGQPRPWRDEDKDGAARGHGRGWMGGKSQRGGRWWDSGEEEEKPEDVCPEPCTCDCRDGVTGVLVVDVENEGGDPFCSHPHRAEYLLDVGFECYGGCHWD